ncbi:MAG: hypothetical protein HOI67_12325, partial [Gammaproteobacteria bacterium]|nr:hypothetical protein [Gammaproteobacteria bacterium]
IQNRQQSAKTDKLPNHHAELDDLFVTKMFMEPIKKSIVDTVVIKRQFIRILKSNTFAIGISISFFVQLRDLIFT